MQQERVNDFSFRVATVNGTGSQSSNIILYKTLFRMGIGVCGKNLFPSNIQGLPTWFQIRVSPKGYQNLRIEDDIAVLMNPATWQKDLAAMRDGTTLIYNSDVVPLGDADTGNRVLYGLPVETLAKQIEVVKLRPLLKNLFYVGAIAHLYGLDKEVLEGVIGDQFAAKPKAIEANLKALQIGMDYARENFEKKDGYQFQAVPDGNKGKIFVEGNDATALGCVYGGCTVMSWYPITPSSSVAEATEGYFKKFRRDGDTNKFAMVQAEDELAAIGMVFGATWAGARATTATSGPGISLMQEFIGLGYYAELPAVIVDVQRVGPSTGLPTRTQQGDVQMCARAGHGDTKHVFLIPATPKEAFELAQEAFNLADRLQTPVFFLSDLDLGMNNWIDDEFTYTKPQFDRGKVLTKADLEKLGGDWGRYRDVDGDGICYRTLPGTDHPKASFFTRGTGHDEQANYTESPEAYVKNMERLVRKWNTAKTLVPKPEVHGKDSAKVGVIAFGTTHHAMEETLDRLNNDNIKYLRLRAYPFSPEVETFIQSCDTVLVVEQNRDGQMFGLLNEDLPGYQAKLKSVRYYGGFPLSADVVQKELTPHLSGEGN